MNVNMVPKYQKWSLALKTMGIRDLKIEQRQYPQGTTVVKINELTGSNYVSTKKKRDEKKVDM